MAFLDAWTDPLTELKRPYRFLVAFPVYNPGKELLQNSESRLISAMYGAKGDGAKGSADLKKLNGRYDVKDGSHLFSFPVVRCSKPGWKTGLHRIEQVGGGYAKLRTNQPTALEFTPIELELVDTYDHDLEASLTAMLYGKGGLAAPDWRQKK